MSDGGVRGIPLAYLPNVPRFVYGEDEEFELLLTLPSTLWDYAHASAGGDIEADSGMRAAFVMRRDELWTFALRFYEREWPSVQAFIDEVQKGKPFTYYPDRLFQPDLGYHVQLIAPAVGTTYFAVPDVQYPVVQMLSITVVAGALVVPTPPPCAFEVINNSFEAADLTAAAAQYAIDWPDQPVGAYSRYGGPLYQQVSGVMSDPVPDGDIFIGHTAVAGGSAQFGGGLPTYGRAQGLSQRTITQDVDGNPLQPDTDHVVRFWMNMGWLQSSEIGSAPGPHTVSLGMLDGFGHGIVNSLWCWYAVGTLGLDPSGSEQPEFPARNRLFIIPFNSTSFAREHFVELDGWREYTFFGRTNGAGELVLTFGIWDIANYAGGSGFDHIRVNGVCPGDVDEGYDERDITLHLNNTQMGLEVMHRLNDADLRMTQEGVEFMSTIPDPDLYNTQMGIEKMSTPPDPDLYMTQLGLEIMTTEPES